MDGGIGEIDALFPPIPDFPGVDLYNLPWDSFEPPELDATPSFASTVLAPLSADLLACLKSPTSPESLLIGAAPEVELDLALARTPDARNIDAHFRSVWDSVTPLLGSEGCAEIPAMEGTLPLAKSISLISCAEGDLGWREAQPDAGGLTVLESAALYYDDGILVNFGKDKKGSRRLSPLRTFGKKARLCDEEDNDVSSSVASVSRSSRGLENPSKRKNIPSKYCHICTRSVNSVPMAYCANIETGKCRKIVCSKCADQYQMPDVLERIAYPDKNVDWTCSHCRDVCPPKAQCTTYARINKERKNATS